MDLYTLKIILVAVLLVSEFPLTIAKAKNRVKNKEEKRVTKHEQESTKNRDNRDGEDFKEPSWFCGKYLLAGATGLAAVAAAPAMLTAAGFGSAGIVAGSLAASLQGGAVASGSTFAVLQSAGMAGLGLSTKAALFGAGFYAGKKAEETVFDCDKDCDTCKN